MTSPRPHPKANVTFANINPGEHDAAFTMSLTGAMRYDLVGAGRDARGKFTGCRHLLGGGEIMNVTGPRIAQARCSVVDSFLQDPKLKGVEWLFWVDSDMTFEPSAVCELLGHAYDGDAKRDPWRPDLYIIGGLAFTKGDAVDRPNATLYTAKEDGSGRNLTQHTGDFPRNQLVKTHGTGAAFIMVHRQVLLHMAKPYPDGFGTSPEGVLNPHPWYVEGIHDGQQYGEDIAFCRRAAALGYDTYVHTGVKSGHMKRIEMDEEFFDMVRCWHDHKAEYGYGGLRLPPDPAKQEKP